jgi:tRNA-specific 2-thiouridylase
VLGRHDGIINFTVGQRRGLNLGGQAEPLFVLKLDPAAARVVVGPRAALASSRVELGGVNWLDIEAAGAIDRPVMVKLRSAQQPVPARLSASGTASAVLELDEPVMNGVAPGQAGVVYDGARLIAGGWIRRERRADKAA